MQYRAGIFLYMLSSLYPFVTMAAWLTVSEQTQPEGFRASDFVNYYLAATIVNQISTVWVAGDWEEEIRTGSLSVQLTRPIDPAHLMFCRELCRRLLAGLVGLVALTVARFFFSDLTHPDGYQAYFLTAAALLLSLILNFLMASAIGMLTFWLTQISRIYMVWAGVGFFLSGWVAPLSLLPGTVRTIAEWSPFNFILSYPVGLLTGSTTFNQGLERLPLGLAWALVFYFSYRVLWRAGLRRFDAVGS